MDGHKVFITGGAGFLGRGILRRAQREHWNTEFTVYSRDEQKQDECKRKYGTDNIRYVLGDVRNAKKMELEMRGHDVVIHTAAIKYIPEAELNVLETIDINVRGSDNVIHAARYAGVNHIIGISTDKACQPINVYGMTKALMERIFDEASNYKIGQVACVRYGNVIGSTGSLATVLKRQACTTGRMTITDSNMTRYWISVDEAIDLINTALYMPSGSVVIAKPGASTIMDVANAIMPIIAIDVIGIRPGEKMHENMIHEAESVRADDCEKFYLLHKVGTPPVSAPFELVSNKPYKWFSVEELRAMIADAESV